MRGWHNLPRKFAVICQLLAEDNLCNELRGKEHKTWWVGFVKGVCDSPQYNNLR